MPHRRATMDIACTAERLLIAGNSSVHLKALTRVRCERWLGVFGVDRIYLDSVHCILLLARFSERGFLKRRT